MNKTKIMLVVINILVTSIIVALYLQSIQADPHGDFPFFVGSIHFGILLVFFAGEGIALIIRKTLRAPRVRARSKRALLLAITIGALTLSFMPAIATCAVDVYVDIWGVDDDKADGIYPEGYSRYLGWEIYIFDAMERFHNTFNIHMRFWGWGHFDSTDYHTDIAFYLREAMDQTNWDSGVTTFNGRVMDIMLVLCGQWLDHDGFAFGYSGACIIRAIPHFEARIQVVMHELTHCFQLTYPDGSQHCPNVNSCVMTGSPWTIIIPKSWCSLCIELMQPKLHLYDREYTSSGGGGGGGSMYECAW